MTAGGYGAGASCCLVASLASGSGDPEQDDAGRLSVEMLAILKRADLFQQMVA